MLDLDTMRNELRVHLGTDDTDFPDTKCDLYLNRSYWEILDKFHFREKEVSATFVTIAGTRLYPVPSPFEALRKLSITDPNTFDQIPLDRFTLDQYDQNFVDDPSGAAYAMPTNYVREDGAIRLWPTPDDVYTINIKYWTVLADLSDSNLTPPIPQSWHELILLGGIWRAYFSLGDYVRGNFVKASQISMINTQIPVQAKEEEDTRRGGVNVKGRHYDV